LAGPAEAALAVGPSTLPVNGRRLGYLAISAIPKHNSLLTVSQMLKLLIKLTTINCKSSKTKQTKTQNQKPKSYHLCKPFCNSTIPHPSSKNCTPTKSFLQNLHLQKNSSSSFSSSSSSKLTATHHSCTFH
jgi:hypothetical protein